MYCKNNNGNPTTMYLGGMVIIFYLYCFCQCIVNFSLSFTEFFMLFSFSGNTTDFSSSPTKETDHLGKPRFTGMSGSAF